MENLYVDTPRCSGYNLPCTVRLRLCAGPLPSALLGSQEYTWPSLVLSCTSRISYVLVAEFWSSIVSPRFKVYTGAGYPFALQVRVAVVPCTTALFGVPVVKVVAVGASETK